MIYTKSIDKLLFDCASSHPDRIAIKTEKQEISYKLLLDLTLCFAAHLKKEGVARSSCVAIDTKDKILAVIGAFACAVQGARWLEASNAALSNKYLGITHLIHDGRRQYAKGRNIIRVHPGWFKWPADGPSLEDMNFPGLLSAQDTWMIAHSSGTTGMPKYMAVSSENFWKKTQEPYFDGVDGVVTAGYLFPALSWLAMTVSVRVFFTGGTIVVGNDYNVLVSCGVKHVTGSPTHFQNLIRGVDEPSSPLIGNALIGGGPASKGFLDTMLRYFGVVDYAYGSTEASVICTNRNVNGSRSRSVSVGRPWPGCAIEVVDENGDKLPPLAEGEIRVSSPSIVPGYINDIESTNMAFKGAWFYPGDIGYLSENGDLTVVGRSNDQLNIGGAKVNAVVVEAALTQHNDVVDAACFSLVDENEQAMLAAVIKVEDGVGRETLLKELGEAVSVSVQYNRSKIPKRIYFVDDVPRNENGKIVRYKIADFVREIDYVCLSLPERGGS